MDREIAQKGGLVFCGLDHNGEELFIGTDKQWALAADLQEHKNHEIDLVKEEGLTDEHIENCAGCALCEE